MNLTKNRIYSWLISILCYYYVCVDK